MASLSEGFGIQRLSIFQLEFKGEVNQLLGHFFLPPVCFSLSILLCRICHGCCLNPLLPPFFHASRVGGYFGEA